jgi:hypothetical protein
LVYAILTGRLPRWFSMETIIITTAGRVHLRPMTSEASTRADAVRLARLCEE